MNVTEAGTWCGARRSLQNVSSSWSDASIPATSTTKADNPLNALRAAHRAEHLDEIEASLGG